VLRRRTAGRLGTFMGQGVRVAGIGFVDSRSSGLVQVADAIAYIIHRHFGGDTEFMGLFEGIERKAWRGNVTGGLYL